LTVRMSHKSQGEDQAKANLVKLRKHLLEFTCRLVRLDGQQEIIGIASGFLAEVSGRLVLFSAGHVLNKGDWFLETSVWFKDTNETVLIPLRDIWYFEERPVATDLTPTVQDCEFAFGLINQQLLQAEASKDARLAGKPFAFIYYKGPLTDEPILKNEPYTYSSWNKVSFGHAFKSYLDRYATGEFCMSYEGRTEDRKLYRFKLARPHQGDAYYRGASGSPIVDPAGKVVSLLIGGDERTSTLFGLPITDYLHIIREIPDQSFGNTVR
jgi:hypothetical protein